MGTKPLITQTATRPAQQSAQQFAQQLAQQPDRNTLGGTTIVVPDAATHPVLDQQVLEELRQYSDDQQDLVQELVSLFLRETPMQLLALQEALRDADKEEVERRSHTLKGSAGSIGACRLREICEQIECYARSGSLPVVEETVESMTRELHAISDELKRL